LTQMFEKKKEDCYKMTIISIYKEITEV